MREFMCCGDGWGIKSFSTTLTVGVSGGGGPVFENNLMMTRSPFTNDFSFVFICCAVFLCTHMSTRCPNRFYLPKGLAITIFRAITCFLVLLCTVT